MLKGLLIFQTTVSPFLISNSGYYTQPITTPAPEIEQLKDFWQWEKRPPQTINSPSSTGVSGILVKTQGDFPAFWPREQSFLAVMEEFYDRVCDKSSAVI